MLSLIIHCQILPNSFSVDLIIPLLILFPSLTFKALAFNIDEEYPIVITNEFNGENAHFGASVALLSKSATLSTKSNVSGWVIIGAPKANSTNANHSQIYEPGLIWRCALGTALLSNNNLQNLCEIVEMDPTGDYDPYDPNLPSLDRKDGGWLGGSMSIGNSDKFVTCASRWINKKFKNAHLLNGICYWLDKSNLLVENTRNPANWPWLPPKLSYRLSPLLNHTKQSYNETHYKDTLQLQPSNTITPPKFDWAVGQFGFSVHVTPKNELIAGAVGILDWTGSVVYYKDTKEYRSQFHRYNGHVGYSAFSEVIVARAPDHLKYLGTENYFGYSVTSGRYFREKLSGNRTQFAAGAPRSSHMSGKVLVFTVNESMKGRSEGTLKLLIDPIEGNQIPTGNHYGSYFGYSLLSVDVNKDGFDDLLVGAPLFGTSFRLKRNVDLYQFMTTDDAEEESINDDQDENSSSKMKSGDEGCVFVYMSSGINFTQTPQSLCGDKLPGARFGTAITSLQDINADGYNDIAVGAPYENEGRGAVYIYHGGKEFTFAQKLKPEKVDKRLRSFGWSLSWGADIDTNGYSDLAVGAYETNQVVIFRTIPIVHFNASLTSSTPKLLSSTEKFNLTSCLSYTGHGRMPTGLGVWVRLTVEVEPDGRRLVSLIHDDGLLTADSNGENILSSQSTEDSLIISRKRFLFFRNAVTTCYNFTAKRIGILDGLTRTVPIRQEYWMNKRAKGPVKPIQYVMTETQTTIGRNPVLTVNLNSSKSEFDDFKTILPLPAGNTYGAGKLILPVGTVCEADGDPECVANLTINAFLVDYKSKQIYGKNNPFLIGSVSIVTLAVELANQKEAANLPIFLSIQWSQPPSVRRFPSNCQLKSRAIICEVRRPIKKLQREVFAIELDMSNVYGERRERMLEIYLEANSSSRLVQESKYVLQVPLTTKMQPQSFNFLGSKVEYSPGNVSIPTFVLSQAFEVGLEGPSTAASLHVVFQIPGKIFLHKWQELIALKKPTVAYDGDFTCSPVNGSFIDDDQGQPSLKNKLSFQQLISFSKKTSDIDIEGVKEKGYNNHDFHHKNDYQTLWDGKEENSVDETTQILLGKIRRFKRYISSVGTEQMTISSQTETLSLNCNKKKKNVVSCLQISCIFFHFAPQKKAVVEFKLKMYNKVAALVLNHESHEEDISSLLITSKATVWMLDSRHQRFGQSGNLRFTSFLGIPPPQEIPAWVYIVSVAGGLLLLTMVILILKKCGFFRRSKREELLRQMAIDIQKRAARNLPGTSSTARVMTSSFSGRHRRSSKGSVSGNSCQRKMSFLKSKQNYSPDRSSSPPVTYRRELPISHASAPENTLPWASPATIAKQREMPGAVDLNELRRLYSYVDENEFY